MIITYDPDNGLALPDSKWFEWIEIFTSNPVDTIVGSNIAIDLIRFKVLTKELDYKKIKFKFNNEEIDVDKNGYIEYWPVGFCDHFERILQCKWKIEKESEKLNDNNI